MTDFIRNTNQNGIMEYIPFPQVSHSLYYTPRVVDILVTHLDSCRSSNTPSTFECPVCYESISNSERVSNSCEHNLCVTCTLKHLETTYIQNRPPCCPLCRHHMIVLETPDKTIYNRIGEFLDKLPDEELESIIECEPRYTSIIEMEVAENILQD